MLVQPYAGVCAERALVAESRVLLITELDDTRLRPLHAVAFCRGQVDVVRCPEMFSHPSPADTTNGALADPALPRPLFGCSGWAGWAGWVAWVACCWSPHPFRKSW